MTDSNHYEANSADCLPTEIEAMLVTPVVTPEPGVVPERRMHQSRFAALALATAAVFNTAGDQAGEYG